MSGCPILTLRAGHLTPARAVQVSEKQTPRGYRMTYSKRGLHAARTVVDANNAQYVVQREGWYFHVLDASLAKELRQAVGSSF